MAHEFTPETTIKGQCPCCGSTVRLKLRFTENPFYSEETPEYVVQSFMAGLQPGEREVLELAERTGLLAAYEKTAVVVLADNPRGPASVRKKFLSFLRKPVKLKLTPALDLAFRSTFPDGKTFTAIQEAMVAAVIVDDILRLLIPVALLRPLNVSAVSGKIKVNELSAQMTAVDNWVRTKNGYIPASAGTFFSEMNKRNFGAFARLGL